MKSDFSCEMWSINKWLRYTGFRLYVTVDRFKLMDPDANPTRIGLRFYGWSEL